VNVKVVNNLVHLEGTVQTENQKAVAEQAARKIIGEKKVRNLINVQWAAEHG
jgi:osmotically-inducible protein OsmY